MPLTLIRRAAGDTLGKLENAALQRFREAEKLYAQGEPLGAMYLYGCSIEIRLKVAYYRTIGLVPNSAIDSRLHRKPAEDKIRLLPRPVSPRHPQGGPSPGHNVVGWAYILEQERAQPGNIPMNSHFAQEMHQHVTNVFYRWAEFLRYRANTPYNEEVEAVRAAAQWFRRNTRRLWR